MKFLKNSLIGVYNKILLEKVSLFKVLGAITALVFVSFLIEYLIFGGKLNSFKKSSNEIEIVKNSDVFAENFILSEDNGFISQSDNASLILSVQSRFINNLEVLLENPDTPIVVKYINPKTKKEVTLEKIELQESIEKHKFKFLSNLVFKIENNPEKIFVQALKAQTKIAEIKIDNKYYFNFYRFMFIVAMGGLILTFIALRKKVGKNPEFIFLAVALICGSLISISEKRSFASWDEKIHYKNIDEVSFKNIIKKDAKDIYANVLSPYSYSIKEQRLIDQYSDNNYKKEKKIIKGDIDVSISNLFRQIGYIPSIVALVAGRILHLPAHVIFMLGRWVNVLVFSLAVFFAIRKLKTGKMIMSVVALFPTSIFVASHYGYDSWVIAFTMLGLAYLFSELQQPDKKITLKEMIIMIGSLVIGCGPKAVYFPLLFLLFLLRPSKFDSLKQYKKFILVTVCSILFVVSSFMLPLYISSSEFMDKRGGDNVNPSQQIEFILSEPVVYAKILFNFMKGYLSLENASGFITNFAYLGQVKGYLLILMMLAIVTFIDKNKYDKQTANRKVRLWIVGVFIISIAFIATALYVSFTAVRSVGIAGVQSRYLIPLIFPLFFVIGSSRMKNPVNRNVYSLAIFSVMAVVLMLGVWDLIIKLYY